MIYLAAQWKASKIGALAIDHLSTIKRFFTPKNLELSLSNTATNLFEPFRMGNILLANRFVMNPMTRCLADATGTPQDLMAEYYG